MLEVANTIIRGFPLVDLDTAWSSLSLVCSTFDTCYDRGGHLEISTLIMSQNLISEETKKTTR